MSSGKKDVDTQKKSRSLNNITCVCMYFTSSFVQLDDGMLLLLARCQVVSFKSKLVKNNNNNLLNNKSKEKKPTTTT